MAADVHALVRTSPKGGPFIGRCIKCGKTELRLSQMHEPCANPSGTTDEQALLDVIAGRTDP